MALYEQLGEEAVWSSKTSSADTVVTLVARNDGNLVLYKPRPSSSSHAIPNWAGNTRNSGYWDSNTFNSCRVDGKVLKGTISSVNEHLVDSNFNPSVLAFKYR